jgi:hypothetical protein
VSVKYHALAVPVDKMRHDFTLRIFLDDHGPVLSVLGARCLELDLNL